VLPDPIDLIALPALRTGRITLLSALLELYHFRRLCWPSDLQLIA
jgi:hypothetical protein